jgi:hypothetical protein
MPADKTHILVMCSAQHDVELQPIRSLGRDGGWTLADTEATARRFTPEKAQEAAKALNASYRAHGGLRHTFIARKATP